MIPIADLRLLTTSCHVAGRWYSDSASSLLTVGKPATGERLAKMPSRGAVETREAITGAAAALAKVEGLVADAYRQGARVIRGEIAATSWAEPSTSRRF